MNYDSQQVLKWTNVGVRKDFLGQREPISAGGKETVENTEKCKFTHNSKSGPEDTGLWHFEK